MDPSFGRDSLRDKTRCKVSKVKDMSYMNQHVPGAKMKKNVIQKNYTWTCIYIYTMY